MRSRAKRARNVQKTCDARANLLFCLILHLTLAFHCSRCRLVVGSKRDEGMSFYVLTYASSGRACLIEKQTVARSGLSLRTVAFHSTKTFENLEKRQMVQKNVRKRSQKFRKLLNFRNANHST